jgi:hypothetical protein
MQVKSAAGRNAPDTSFEPNLQGWWEPARDLLRGLVDAQRDGLLVGKRAGERHHGPPNRAVTCLARVPRERPDRRGDFAPAVVDHDILPGL